MIVSTRKCFVYARIPKTGSTSVSSALEPYRRGTETSFFSRIGRKIFPNSQHAWLTNFRAHPHWGLQAASEILPTACFDRFLKFTVSRHPYSRTVSLYNHILRHRDDEMFGRVFDYVYENCDTVNDFVHTLLERPLPPQAMLVIDYHGNVLADAVVRIELLEEEIAPILCDLGISTKIPYLNMGGYDSCSLTREAKNIIRSVYAVDFELFGYNDYGAGSPSLERNHRTHELGSILALEGARNFRPWFPLSTDLPS
jgi:hypothetical protein